MNREVFSTYQAARVCNAHHTTVINWVKEGILKAYTTPGGHRRVKKEDLIEFMQRYEIPIPDLMHRKFKQILVVDDDPEALEEYKDALSGSGFELGFAAGGFEAGMKMYRQRPNLILLDFKMPGLDGFQVCDILHRDEETQGIPIIAVTVLSSKAEIERIKDCGVKGYFSKPIDMDRLIKTIKDVLGIKV
ncbi:MAG: response regulator [Candidatus Kaelpia imicola]|nr:response regulator [Candidatus Kaelpia imicola]